MEKELQRIVDLFVRKSFADPTVYRFEKENKSAFDDIKSLLKEKGFNLVNVNSALTVDSEDYNMLISKAGFTGPTGKETINDCFVSDEQKKSLITIAKLREIEERVNNKTVLVVEYNDQVLNNHTFYETVRSWLKDGVPSLRSIKGIVYLETTEKIRDFCLYGIVYRKK